MLPARRTDTERRLRCQREYIPDHLDHPLPLVRLKAAVTKHGRVAGAINTTNAGASLAMQAMSARLPNVFGSKLTRTARFLKHGLTWGTAGIGRVPKGRLRAETMVGSASKTAQSLLIDGHTNRRKGQFPPAWKSITFACARVVCAQVILRQSLIS